MTDILTGFAVIAVAIGVGWALARAGIVRGDDRLVLNRVAFFAASPTLLFTVLARADVRAVFSRSLLTHATAVLIVGTVLFVTMRALGSRGTGPLLMASYCGIYSNANNIGLPVAVYVLGDGSLVAPLLVLQLVVLAPLVMGELDAQAPGGVRWQRVVSQPVRNPIVLGSALGVVWSAWALPQPSWLMLPLELVGGAAVPLMLIAFGISLVGQKPLQPGTGRRDVGLASVGKLVLLPVCVYALGTWVFGLGPEQRYAATVLAALPSAQNMYQYALRYRVGELVARDTILVTTVLSLPVCVALAALLHP